jgi:prepilin-type N-terminal cleavage/methylation domain-containing protein
MLSKIISKKIKSPLSLLGEERQSNLSGFSLIELMVAITILAMAIFGIFHAYSVGFMGMADARARTVATNYAREAMEDIKNMDFDKISTSGSSNVTVDGITYNRQVIVQENPNIKRVITTVTWEDRNGKQKMVETDMVVHFIETTAGDATRIILYADPYSVLVLKTDEYGNPVDPTAENKSTITAVVKDARGNTVTDWDKEIVFSLTTGSGDLSTNKILPENFVDGRAIITFTSDTNKVEVTITASTEGLAPDSVNINVYDPGIPVKINLTANPNHMLPNVGTKSVITATIVDAGGTKVNGTTNEIFFSIAGPGSFSSSTTETTKTEAAVNGEIEIDLFSNGDPGTITVTASANGLEPGVVVVLTGGYITLFASPIEVPNYEESVITVTTKDVNLLPINYVGTINLSLVSPDGGSGDLPSSVTFSGTTSSEEVTFTAFSKGTVNITAEDGAGILTLVAPFSLTVIEKLTPHHIIVYAIPVSISAGGAETLITAKVMTEGNVKVTSYCETATFETTSGTFFDSSSSIIITFDGGVATVELYSSDIPETATITVSSMVPADPEYIITGSTEVGFHSGPDHIKLNAVPQNILAADPYSHSCIVTAEIVDYKGTLISNYNKDISFSISPHLTTIRFLEASTSFLTKKVKKGIATVVLMSGNDAGTAVIYAFSENLFGSLNIPVGSNLELVEDSVGYNFDSDTNIGTVSFDIDVQGADLILEEMQVYWDPAHSEETLNKIEIKSPFIADSIIVYDTNIDFPDSPASSGEIINVTDNTLSTGISNIKMYFSTDMNVKNILDVTFNTNSGDYTVNLKWE